MKVNFKTKQTNLFLVNKIGLSSNEKTRLFYDKQKKVYFLTGKTNLFSVKQNKFISNRTINKLTVTIRRNSLKDVGPFCIT